MGTNGGKSTVREMEGKQAPIVWIHPKAYYLMSLWASLAGDKSYEFTCLGRAVMIDGEVHVTDAYAVKHEGSSGAVDMDDHAQIQLMALLDEGGIDGDLVDTKTRVDSSEIRCWTHSHPGKGDSATFWSGTDDACIERFLTGPWCVAIVFDSEGRHPKCRIDLKEPRYQIKAELQLHVPYLTDNEVTKAKKLFTETSFKKGYATSSGGGYKGPYGAGRYSRGHEPWNGNTSTYSSSYSKGSGGKSSGGKSSSSSSASSSSRGPAPLKQETAEEAELKQRIMALFGLTEDQVEPDWIAWCREADEEFGDFAIGLRDETKELSDETQTEQVSQEELDAFEAQVPDDANAQQAIAFIDISEDGDSVVSSATGSQESIDTHEENLDWVTGADVVPDDKVESSGETVGDMTVYDIEEDIAEADAAQTAAQLPIAASKEEQEAAEDAGQDTQTDVTVVDRMISFAAKTGLDRLAHAVAEKEIDKDEAIIQAQRNHDLSQAQAESEISARLGV
jgi:hypothetical protein